MAHSTARIEELEARALALPEPERARLVGSLVRSLTGTDDEVSLAWLDEAERRDRDMGDDPGEGIAADEVLRKARKSLE